MKKILIPFLLLSIMLSGCWDLIESEKLGLVTLAGIDISDNGKIRLVVQEVSEQSQSSGAQQGGGASKGPPRMHEAVAPTFSEAVEMINAANYHRTYFAHASAFILSEELVRSKGIKDFIDYFERTPEFRRNMWLLISKKGEFENIFTSNANFEAGNDSGKVIRGILWNKSRTSYISTNTLGDFLNLFWETGSEPYTSGIGTVGPSEAKQGTGAGSDKASQKELVIENTAVFNKDKLAGWMDDRESKGLLWVAGGIKGGSLSITYEGKKIVMKIVRMNSVIKPIKVKGKIQINIRIMLSSNIGESQAKLILKNNEVGKKLEDLQAEEVKRQIFAALNKTKELNADVFGFGNYIFGKYPKEWRGMKSQKPGYLRSIAVNIEIDSIVNHVGLIKNNAP